MNRRSFLTAASGLAAATLLPANRRPTTGTRLILLGTAGGPRPQRTRSAPAQVIVVDDVAYVVDCGDGVARQLVLAGAQLTQLRHILITHHHSDHNAGYGNLILLAWAAGLQTRVDTWGREQLAQFLAQIPASAVSHVEVATNPSAKNDPEGTAGIINIVLNRQADAGLSGGLNASTGTTRGQSLGQHRSPIGAAHALPLRKHVPRPPRHQRVVGSGESCNSNPGFRRVTLRWARAAALPEHDVSFPVQADRERRALCRRDAFRRSIRAPEHRVL